MNWSLFVDTDSLYIETRKRFGVDARLDYLSLPLYIVNQLGDINFFQEKVALVMRHGKEWPAFVGSLERFGYIIIPTDRGMQPITIKAQVLNMVEEADGIVLVTASDKIAVLVEEVIQSGAHICVATFEDNGTLRKAFENEKMVDILIMNEEWLWKNKPKEV